MPTTFNNDGKPAYMYDSVGDVWYAVGAKVDTASGYEWAGSQTFLNTVTTDATVILRDGFNNFLNPAARDAALTSPVQGTLVFVRQDAGGATINQIQYYTGSAWSALEADITAVTAGTGLSGGGTSGSVTLSVDTAVVATTSNTLTMTNKDLSSGTNTFPNTLATLTGTETLTNKTLTTPTITQGQSTPSFSTNAYTLVSGDAGKLLIASNGSTAATVNIPTDATTNFAIGTQITILQSGSGQMTIQAASSGTTTVYSTGATAATPKCRTQYSAITLWKSAVDTWYAFGDIS